MWDRLKSWAANLKREVLALWFCCRHPRTPLAAKLVAAFIVGYALSPIDLIPDFIPVLGYLDDLIIVPIGVYVAIRLVPPAVLEECRSEAARWIEQRKPEPRNYLAAALIVALWFALGWLAWRGLEDRF